MSIRITVTDTENGDTETQEITDDYVVIVAGSYYLAHANKHANGTHVLTIKREARP